MAKLASITTRSLSVAYSNYKKNQEIKKIKEIKLKKLQEIQIKILQQTRTNQSKTHSRYQSEQLKYLNNLQRKLQQQPMQIQKILSDSINEYNAIYNKSKN